MNTSDRLNWEEGVTLAKQLITIVLCVGAVLVGAAVFAALAGCTVLDPMANVTRFLTTPAGQKLVDRIEMQGAAEIIDPSVEFYAVTGFGMRTNGVRYDADMTSSGEVTEDERGPAPPFATPDKPQTSGGDPRFHGIERAVERISQYPIAVPRLD